MKPAFLLYWREATSAIYMGHKAEARPHPYSAENSVRIESQQEGKARLTEFKEKETRAGRTP
jgi:hypothetical protein